MASGGQFAVSPDNIDLVLSAPPSTKGPGTKLRILSSQARLRARRLERRALLRTGVCGGKGCGGPLRLTPAVSVSAYANAVPMTRGLKAGRASAM